PRPDAARPDIFHDRRVADALVKELLDLVQHRLALLAVHLARLLLVERLDVGVGAVGERAVARHRLRQAGGGVAVDGVDADAEAVQLLALERRIEGRALHRAQPRADADGAQVAADRLAHREVRRPRIE